MHSLDRNLRVHSEGTVTELSVNLGFGTFERIRAKRGPFSATYGQFAIVMSDGDIKGPVQLNGSKTLSRSAAPAVYSVLRPNDHISGVLEQEVTYEILLLSSDYVEQFICVETDGVRAYLPLAVRVEAPPLVRSIWRRLSDTVERSGANPAPQTTAFIELLIVKLIEAQVGAPNPAAAVENIEAIKRAVQFIDEHLSEPMEVDEIARIAKLSPFYFSRTFKATYQVSVHRFVLERRLEKARQLLAETDLAISAIALETGFSSQSHLTTTFRQRFGLPPAQYREYQAWGVRAAGPASKVDRT